MAKLTYTAAGARQTDKYHYGDPDESAVLKQDLTDAQKQAVRERLAKGVDVSVFTMYRGDNVTWTPFKFQEKVPLGQGDGGGDMKEFFA